MNKIDNKDIFFKLFNEKLSEFFKDIIILFPNISEFGIFKSGLYFYIIADPSSKKPQDFFNNHISSKPKYREAIKTKDESFFLNDERIEINSLRIDYWIKFINQIKKLWSTIDEDNKEIIWKYFYVLMILSDKCIN